MGCRLTLCLTLSLSVFWWLSGGAQNIAPDIAVASLTPTSQPMKRHRGSYPGYGKIKCDHYCCNCNGKKAFCTGQNRTLHYLPRLPPNIREFRMFRNRYYHLNRSMMANLSNFELQEMNLTNNQIRHIAADTFADFPKITLLDLSYNPIPVPELRATLEGMSTVLLTTLSIAKMGITSLPDDFFRAFRNRTFKKVDLQKNEIQIFNNALFAPFWRTDKVDLAQNVISDVNMSVRVNIKELFLKENRFQMFPDLSRNKSQSRREDVCQESFYYLQHLTVATNHIRSLPPALLRGDCFPHLRHLDISETELTELENDVIADLPSLEAFVVNHMKILNYRPRAFNSTSLTTLSLNNNLRFDKEKMDFRSIFRYCPNLQRLHLVDTKLQWSDEEMFSFLVPLKNLQHLQMQRNRIGKIPEDLLWRLHNLTTLEFMGNNLNSYVLGKALEKVSRLQRLNVQGNGITVLNHTTLPWPFRGGLRWIDFSQNPFSCTCEMVWFTEWSDEVQKNKSVVLHNLANTKQYRCRTPPDLTNTLLRLFRPTRESCAITNPLIMVSVVGSCFLVGLLVLLGSVYRYRWHLRYYVYRFRRRWQYTQVAGGPEGDSEGVGMFRYDAYLAHSPRDLDWVVNSLLPVLEGEQGLKVFVYDRDSLPGNIADNIATYMDQSERILLVISDHYTQDGWRQCEFQHLLYAAFEQSKDVIVILLGDVEAGRMTRDMRRMLTRGTFLQWGDSEEARTAFTSGLKVALVTQNTIFPNVC